MEKQTFFQKHRLQNLRKEELDRKWRAYRDEQRLMESIFYSQNVQSQDSVPSAVPILGSCMDFGNGGIAAFLTLQPSSDFSVGTGDFTIEWFQYQLTGSSFPRVFSFGSWPNAFAVSVEGTTLYLWTVSSSVSITIPDLLNKWAHIAVSRNSGTTRIFLNGIIFYQGTPSYNINVDSTEMYIGQDSGYTSTSYYSGKLVGFHFVKGTSLYNEAFTPLYPISVVENTKLLLKCTNPTDLLIDSSSTSKTVTNNENHIVWSNDFIQLGSLTDTQSWTFTSVQSGSLDQTALSYTINSGKNVWINWGYGASVKLTANGTDETVTSVFPTSNMTYTITMFGELDEVTSISCSESKAYMNFSDIGDSFPNLLSLQLSNVNLSGTNSADIAYLPKNLTSLSFTNIANAPVFGDINTLSKSLTTLRIVTSGDNLAGSTDQLSRDLTSLTLRFGSNRTPNIHGTYANLPPNLTTLFMWEIGGYWSQYGDSRKFFGSYADLPRSIEDLTLMNNLRSSTGDYTMLPPNLKTFFSHQDLADTMLDNSTLNLDDLPKSITSLNILYTDKTPSTYRVLNGNINQLPPNLTSLTLRDVGSLIVGNIEELPTTLTNITFQSTTTQTFGENKITYGGGTVPPWGSTTILVRTSMPSSTVDDFLISWAATIGPTATRTITLQGQRTSASDAAVTFLNGRGKTIVTAP